MGGLLLVVGIFDVDRSVRQFLNAEEISPQRATSNTTTCFMQSENQGNHPFSASTVSCTTSISEWRGSEHTYTLYCTCL